MNDAYPLDELYGSEDIIQSYFDQLDFAGEAVDEDKALDAYESIIHRAADTNTRPERDEHGKDAALALSAQLLTKHFNKFGHVQSNVIDVLLALTRRNRSQTVRLHSIRSLIEIVKASFMNQSNISKDELDWRERIQSFVENQLREEESSMIGHHLIILQKVLRMQCRAGVENRDHKNDPNREMKENRERLKCSSSIERDHSRNLLSSISPRRSRVEDKQIDRSSSLLQHTHSRYHIICPPAPYVFIGNLPPQTSSYDLVSFLAKVEPNLSNYAVQVKHPPRHIQSATNRSNGNRPNAGFAFVSLPSSQSARQVIQYVLKEPYRGRTLNGNFARGPPCHTVLFVQMSPEKEYKEEDGLPVVKYDFTSKDGSLMWSKVCAWLEDYGSFLVLAPGKVRFHDIDHAKLVIRAHHFSIQDILFVPFYDPDEQFETDATRNPAILQANRERKRQLSEERRQSFSLKSGRVVGDDGERYDSSGRQDHVEEYPRASRGQLDGGDRGHVERKRSYSRSPRRTSRFQDRHEPNSTRSRSQPRVSELRPRSRSSNMRDSRSNARVHQERSLNYPVRRSQSRDSGRVSAPLNRYKEPQNRRHDSFERRDAPLMPSPVRRNGNSGYNGPHRMDMDRRSGNARSPRANMDRQNSTKGYLNSPRSGNARGSFHRRSRSSSRQQAPHLPLHSRSRSASLKPRSTRYTPHTNDRNRENMHYDTQPAKKEYIEPRGRPRIDDNRSIAEIAREEHDRYQRRSNHELPIPRDASANISRKSPANDRIHRSRSRTRFAPILSHCPREAHNMPRNNSEHDTRRYAQSSPMDGNFSGQKRNMDRRDDLDNPTTADRELSSFTKRSRTEEILFEPRSSSGPTEIDECAVDYEED